MPLTAILQNILHLTEKIIFIPICQRHIRFPRCTNGYLEIKSNGKLKKIRIENIHIEEDAGKLYHDLIDGTALIDYNRSGVPLLEIVTAPDFSNGDEAVSFLEEIAGIFRFLEISDCKIEEGSLRADVNLSVCKEDSDTLGTRTEMKNLSSFKSIKKACLYESQRQEELLRNGKPVIFETRRFDENRKITLSMRSKESADDYRYFPEPDLPPIALTSQDIEAVRCAMPELPQQKRKRFTKDFNISDGEADIILSSVNLCNIFEASAEISSLPTVCSKLICTELLSLINKSGISTEQCKINPRKLARTAELLNGKSINNPTAKALLGEIFENDIDPDEYIALHDLAMITDEELIKSRIADILKGCETAVNEYKSGKSKAFGFIVGQVMSDFNGKADPLIINKILKEFLND